MKLTNPTDDELDAAFAEKVAGWTRVTTMEISAFDTQGISYGKMSLPQPIEAFQWNGLIMRYPPRFTQSADAVLPWLEKYRWGVDSCGMTGSTHGYPHCVFWVVVNGEKYEGSTFTGDSIVTAFPRAIVIALLRAHGVEVEFAKQE